MTLSRIFIFLFILFILISPLAYAEKPLVSQFTGLKTYTILASSPGSYFPPQQVSFDPAISKLVNARLDLELNSQGIGGIEIVRILLTKIDRTKDSRHFIDFDPGASGDPVFSVVPEGSKSAIGSIAADHLVLPGNGFIYALARTNVQFLERRKYYVQDNKVVETKQPFLYVGLESKAIQDFPLTSRQSGGEAVASVRKGEKVFVVLNEGENYLVRSSFGLLGWVHIDSGKQESDVIEGIFYAGD